MRHLCPTGTRCQADHDDGAGVTVWFDLLVRLQEDEAVTGQSPVTSVARDAR